MAESKYDNYIITKFLTPEEHKARGRRMDPREPGVPYVNRLLWLDDSIIKGAFYMESHIIEPGATRGKVWVEAHTHECNEVIGFMGTGLNDPHSLQGEIELWIDDEKHILTKSCLVYIPKGLKHCPLTLVRVDQPIVHFTVMTGGQYLWDAK
jgi:hypothetical protein